jgi:hypothetical protein
MIEAGRFRLLQKYARPPLSAAVRRVVAILTKQ